MANLKNTLLGFMLVLSLAACGGPQEHGVAATATAATSGAHIAQTAEATPTPEPKELICHRDGQNDGSAASWENVTCTDTP